MNNKDIRIAMIKNDVGLKQVAKEYGITQDSFSRKIRYELPKEKKKKIFEAIERAAEKKKLEEKCNVEN